MDVPIQFVSNMYTFLQGSLQPQVRLEEELEHLAMGLLDPRLVAEKDGAEVRCYAQRV